MHCYPNQYLTTRHVQLAQCFVHDSSSMNRNEVMQLFAKLATTHPKDDQIVHVLIRTLFSLLRDEASIVDKVAEIAAGFLFSETLVVFVRNPYLNLSKR